MAEALARLNRSPMFTQYQNHQNFPGPVYMLPVGDRPFTDIVYGNRNGFFTILTEPLSLAEEPLIVRQVRLLEVAIVKQWSKKGLMPITHELLSDPVECINDVPL
ncbi:Phosphatidylglycerophosphate phosphatase 1, chloroplastic/mitochondrial [Castilleja foliolosa]|uniref:Phosphatidylglycerophosphate phosphatase 1, chloroplastic/mitochondrial n=1 Tax=Castilleja foliolosa TaxID=1961234 RepID=A0ABD3E8X6_9LAMI